MMRILLAIIGLTLNLYNPVYGQSQAVQDQINKLMPKPVPGSPNVAAVGKFGDYAVSAFNGLPDISIPIFEAKSGDIKVPITLKYHAGGIKRTDHASWVGAGWALQAGGQISRKMNGKPDESDFYTATTTPLQPDIAICSDPNDLPYLRQVAFGNLDTQPDIFSYSFPGKSGNFLLSSQALQPPYLIPYEPFNVNVVNFNNFKITDDHGILYQYGTSATGVVGGIEGSYTSAGSTQAGGSTAWHLMQMTAPNSVDKIVFDYQDLGTINYNDFNDIIQVSDLCDSDGTQDPCPPAAPAGTNVGVGITTNPKGLSHITFATGVVEFIPSAGFRNDESASKSLDRINIYSTTNGAQNLIKVIKFNYSYFRNSTNTADLMLRLDNIQITDNAGALVQQYKFTYQTTYFSWDNNIRSRDYFGFYNGANNTDLIVPQQITIQPRLNSPTTTTPTIGTANRTTNVQYLTEGVLKQIDLPTGGYSQFEYEVNKYTESGVNYTASGLRVSKITSNDGGGSPSIIKSYKYGIDEFGYGAKNFNPNQFLANSEQQIITTSCLSSGIPGFPPPGTLRYRSRTWASNSAYDIDGYDNAPVVYLYVSEYILDAAGNINGKTVYEHDNGIFGGSGVNLVVPFSTNTFKDSFAWKNGLLTRKTIYDKYGNKIMETVNTYSQYASQSKFIGYAANFYDTYTLNLPCGVPCDNQEVQFAYLSQSTGAIRQTGSSEYTYNAPSVVQYVMKLSTNTIDPTYLQPLTTTVTKSDINEQMVTINRYPFNLTANATSTGNAKGIYMLNQKNIFATPIETYSYKDSLGRQLVTSGQVTTFRENSANTNYVVPDQIYLWESAVPVLKSTYVPVAINGTNSGITMDPKFAQRINMLSYDDAGNILSVAKSNDIIVTYVYGYNKTLPVAEVMNAGVTEVFYDGFENLPSGTVVPHTGSGCLNSPTYATVFTVPNGRAYIIEYWYYDGIVWKFKVQTFTNGLIIHDTAIAYDDVRIYPKDAQMKTYTYDPVLGMTSSINESAQTYKYEYDAFGRLAVIRNEKGNIEKQYAYHYKLY